MRRRSFEPNHALPTSQSDNTRTEARVRVVSAGGHLLQIIEHSRATQMVSELIDGHRRYRVISKTRQRYIALCDTLAGVSAQIPQSPSFSYREPLADGRSVWTLKRALPDGRFTRWSANA
jgi:hypothetical protein